MKIQGEMRIERIEPFRLFGVARSARSRVILARHQPAHGSAPLKADLVLRQAEMDDFFLVGQKLRVTIELSRYDRVD